MQRPEPGPEPLSDHGLRRLHQGPAQWLHWPEVQQALHQAFLGVPERGLGAAEFVLEEWFVNACTHGRIQTRRVVRVWVDAHADAQGWQLRLIDDGHPFNPLMRSAPDTRAPLAERGKGGLGIHLMRQMTQDARYRRWHGLNALWLSWRPS